MGVKETRDGDSGGERTTWYWIAGHRGWRRRDAAVTPLCRTSDKAVSCRLGAPAEVRRLTVAISPGACPLIVPDWPGSIPSESLPGLSQP